MSHSRGEHADSWEIAPGRYVEVALGDITAISTDAMVNAANSPLVGGGGVDGAVHRVGGPAVMDDLERRYGPVGVRHCSPGSALVSTAGNLPARWVIHAVGPVYRDGLSGEPELLASAYETSLRMADELGAAHVTFPAISTGAYGFPATLAAGIAVRTVLAALRDARSVRRVTLVALPEKSFRPLAASLRRARLEETGQS